MITYVQTLSGIAANYSTEPNRPGALIVAKIVAEQVPAPGDTETRWTDLPHGVLIHLGERGRTRFVPFTSIEYIETDNGLT